MGRAIDLFVTYRFLKLLTTPFNKMDAFKYGIIDKDGLECALRLWWSWSAFCNAMSAVVQSGALFGFACSYLMVCSGPNRSRCRWMKPLHEPDESARTSGPLSGRRMLLPAQREETTMRRGLGV